MTKQYIKPDVNILEVNELMAAIVASSQAADINQEMNAKFSPENSVYPEDDL